jgi:hypothetical protein
LSFEKSSRRHHDKVYKGLERETGGDRAEGTSSSALGKNPPEVPHPAALSPRLGDKPCVKKLNLNMNLSPSVNAVLTIPDSF